MSTTPKTMEELREQLTETFMAIKEGSIDIKQAEAMTNMAGKIINSVKIEIQAAELTGDKAPIAFLAKK